MGLKSVLRRCTRDSGLMALGLCAAMAAQAATFSMETVMTGLAAPRGLAFGPDGALYVTEAGTGGTGPGLVGGSGAVSTLGASSSLSRWFGGLQTRIMSGLPSLADSAGTDAAGLQDIVFGAGGQAYGVIGLGASGAQRATLGAAGAALGTLVRLDLGSASFSVFADIAQFEDANNPAGDAIDSNPYGLAVASGGHLLVADAGGNSLLRVDGSGAISALTTLPPAPNPLPFGPPVYQAVPTTVAVGPDGGFYFGQLTGFPFPPGGAVVYRLDPVSGQRTEAFGGFTNIIDIAFDDDGNLYVLQLSANGLTSPSGPGTGLLVKVEAGTGNRSIIADAGLFFPGGLAIEESAAGPVFYVSNGTNSPGAGTVLRISAVPEPGGVALVLLVLGAAAVARRARRT